MPLLGPEGGGVTLFRLVEERYTFHMPKRYAEVISTVLIPTALSFLAFAWGLSLAGTALDQWLSLRIVEAAAIKAGNWQAGVFVSCSELVLLVAIGLAAFSAGRKLGQTGRVVVWMQLFAGIVLMQCCLYSIFGGTGMPVSDLCSLTACGAAGCFLKHRDWSRERERSQRYQRLLKQQELQQVRLKLANQDERERRMLAGDLHDQVLNDLKAIRLHLEQCRGGLEIDQYGQLDALLSHAMSSVREVMDSLFPSVLEHLGLVAAVEDCLRHAAERFAFTPKMKSSVAAEQLEILTSMEQLLLYRLVQEAISNIGKHAAAKTGKVTVALEQNRLELRVVDDGIGMTGAQIQSDSRGLRYMKERADLIGATISWSAGENDKGTEVAICLDVSGRSSDSSSDH